MSQSRPGYLGYGRIEAALRCEARGVKLAEANLLAHREPETWSRIRRYLLLSGFLTYRLTGRYVDSVAAQVGYLPFDFKRSRWASRLDWKWQVASFDRAWLPELVDPATPLGQLTAAAGTHLGLAAGTPVIASAGDKQAEALGAGAVTPEVAALSFGTTATIGTETDTCVIFAALNDGARNYIVVSSDLRTNNPVTFSEVKSRGATTACSEITSHHNGCCSSPSV